jgi:hypothetical protein
MNRGRIIITPRHADSAYFEKITIKLERDAL